MSDQTVSSREYKVMLRPGNFTGSEKSILSAAHSFWREFAKAITGVASPNEDLTDVKTRRLVRFYDTRDTRLNTSGYIVRERRSIDNDLREITLKFRHPDRYVAQDRTMRAHGVKQSRTKFEEDIKVPFISLFSFSTTAGIDNDVKLNRLKDIGRMFPDVPGRLKEFAEDTALVVMNNFTARETVIVGAEIGSAKNPGVRAECALIIWHNTEGKNRKPVPGEFSFRFGDSDEKYDGRASRRAYDVFGALFKKIETWVDRSRKRRRHSFTGDCNASYLSISRRSYTSSDTSEHCALAGSEQG